MRFLKPLGDPRYRSIGEAGIIDFFLLQGWPFEVRAGNRAAAERDAKAALDRLVAMGLPYKTRENGGRLFDPVEAFNFLRWAGLEKGEPTFAERLIPTVRRLLLEAHPTKSVPAGVPPPDALGPQRYAVTIRRTFNLEGRVPGERIRLRLPLPIEDAALSDLRIEFLPPNGVETKTFFAAARLDVVLATPINMQVTIGFKAAFTSIPVIAGDVSTNLNAAEAELYLRPSEGLIHVSDRVRRLADELAGTESDRERIIRRFWNFMHDELASGTLHYDQLDPAQPADWVLEQGWFDCQLGSALLAALCRAQGIPARLVTGYLLHVTAPALHTWLEIWISERGWAPFDLYCWGLLVSNPDTGDGQVNWRDYYFGRLDHRMAVERPPRLFNGTGAVRLPRAWHRLIAADGPGSTVEFLARETGALVYREYVEVERLGGVDKTADA